MILTGYTIQSEDETLSAAKTASVSVVFEPFAIIKDVVIGKVGIDGLCAIYDGSCSIIRASVWKDAERDRDEEEVPPENRESEGEPEHEEIALRDYQIAMLIRANPDLETKLKEAVSTGMYQQFGDGKTAWSSTDSSGKYRARRDTVDAIFPSKAIQDKSGRLLLTFTAYPQYTNITFSDGFNADTLNLSVSTNKLMGAMNL